MTVPCERTRAVKYAEDFLRDLLYPSKTPKVPRAIRDRAARVLRHFPHYNDILTASEKAPDVFGTPEEPDDEIF